MGLGLRVIAKALSLYVAQLATAVTVELNNFIFQLKKYFCKTILLMSFLEIAVGSN